MKSQDCTAQSHGELVQVMGAKQEPFTQNVISCLCHNPAQMCNHSPFNTD